MFNNVNLYFPQLQLSLSFTRRNVKAQLKNKQENKQKKQCTQRAICQGMSTSQLVRNIDPVQSGLGSVFSGSCRLLGLLKLLLQVLQVGVHIIVAMIFSQIHQHSCSTSTISRPTEAAVTDPSAWWTVPLRIQKSISDLLSVPVTQTGATELAPHSNTLWVSAVSFGVSRLLAALVTSGSSGAVVHLLPHVLADSLQLQLRDVIHRSNYMRNGFGAVGETATWLRLIIFFIVAAFANKAELVFRLLLWSRAWGSVHQCTGSSVRSGQTFRVFPTTSWSASVPPGCLSRRHGS